MYKLLAIVCLVTLTITCSLESAERVPWTSSRVVGSPDPPPKYKTVNAYPKVSFKQPTVVTTAPSSSRLFVAERFGTIWSMPDDAQVSKPDLFLDLKETHKDVSKLDNVRGIGSVYGLAFHPDYPAKPLVYVTYTLNPKNRDKPLLEGTRVSEFHVNQTDPPAVDPATERILVTWREGGHNGGCLKFGPEGYLYITSGDAAPPNPPDPLRAGQDVGNLLSAVLRIDVNRSTDELPYGIPSDNPFVSLYQARPEIWAFGFRNPWKISFDRETGDLWLGDVGWELWEMVYRIERGGNYGWSIMEGPQSVHPDDDVGPTPIHPPAIALPHSESSSVTGGFVYRGTRHSDLVGKYVFADYDTRAVWAAEFHEGQLVSRETITPPELRVVAFAEKHDGELLLVDFESGTMNKLVPNDLKENRQPFPRKLSETGLFSDVSKQTPAPGVYPFEINRSMWMDGATATRFIALPEKSSVRWYPEKQQTPVTGGSLSLFYPEGAVLAKTISLETIEGVRNVETQLLHYDGRFWNAYSYRWNGEQTDADLVDATGESFSLTVPDQNAPEKESDLRWTIQGRQLCLRCHNRWNEFSLAFNIPQLNLESSPQLVMLQNLKLLQKIKEEKGKKFDWSKPVGRLVSRESSPADVEAHARSYLHANCAHCHQRGAGGTTTIDLRFDIPLAEMKLLNAKPMQGTLGIKDGQLIHPGDSWRSILQCRMTVTGTGHMPHIGSERVDEEGLSLIERWIVSIAELNESAPLAVDLYQHEWNEFPNVEDEAFIERLLSSPEGSLFLESKLRRRELSQAHRDLIVRMALGHPDPSTKRFFTRWLPASSRVPTLGPIIKPETLLASSGNAQRGRMLFFNEKLTQCARCHRVGEQGGNIGPKLDDVGKRLKPVEIIQSLLEPSRKVDPKFRTWIAITDEGKVHSGLLLEESSDSITLVNVKGKKVALKRSQIEDLQPQNASLMPDQLLRDLTREQAADLLAYLMSLRN